MNRCCGAPARTTQSVRRRARLRAAADFSLTVEAYLRASRKKPRQSVPAVLTRSRGPLDLRAPSVRHPVIRNWPCRTMQSAKRRFRDAVGYRRRRSFSPWSWESSRESAPTPSATRRASPTCQQTRRPASTVTSCRRSTTVGDGVIPRGHVRGLPPAARVRSQVPGQVRKRMASRQVVHDGRLRRADRDQARGTKNTSSELRALPRRADLEHARAAAKFAACRRRDCVHALSFYRGSRTARCFGRPAHAR